ncbi:ribosomal protein L32 [Paracoccidioides lutzii Pb01]|uniref:Ribosomal protein L32 n=1 Tax=Paracoccidioides lutzii (strain ATCC MYA-826 / Pb01) TaxID=502779 RepID=A0A0A2V2Z1_PARBA|nr:ribosomal protein L32 [Paracoccidioides lutzii Pb01]KGQ02136.1 ribosomal protein L32 [Paracoccidioides lutzii Pb01]
MAIPSSLSSATMLARLPRLNFPLLSRSYRFFSPSQLLRYTPGFLFTAPAALTLGIPAILSDIWDSVLRAVPKKKTSHMKKRHRQMAGKALKDHLDLNRCSSCGEPKRAHLLCPTCVAAHPVEIFSLAVTPSQVISCSGASSLKVHSTTPTPTGTGTETDFPIAQSIEAAHKIGCHHLATSADGTRFVSVGFGGEVKLWSFVDGMWVEEGGVKESKKVSEIWAVALSAHGEYLAGTTLDGRIKVWHIQKDDVELIRDLETKGSFGMCIALSADGCLTASGHANGNVYIFLNETGRMIHSLSGLVSSVRAVSFSPGGKLLAAAGDSRVIQLYETSSGEQVAALMGHTSWITSLDWSHTGEFLLSSALDGKVKVWSVERRACVATLSESDVAIWSARWLLKVGTTEKFVTASAKGSITFYREATGV